MSPAVEPSIVDLGHVRQVTLQAWGGFDAVQKAGRLAGGVGLRARLIDPSPEPSDYPSLFEVLVRVDDGEGGGL